MGYCGINLKPSTILVFSIAFGISIDDTIHFLVKYRQELSSNDGAIKTNGGRVISLTSFGKNIKTALEKSYESADKILFEGKYYRKDIGFDL